MTTKLFSKVALAVVAGAAAGFTALDANPAQAVLVQGSFSFTFPSSFPTAPNAVGSGTFQFDNALTQQVPPPAFVAIPLTSFTFGLSTGEVYGLGNSIGQVTADFFGSTFAGVQYEPADATGGRPASNLLAITLSRQNYTAFDQSFNLAQGPISYSPLIPVGTTNVPTPALLPGLVGLGLAAVRNRKQQSA